jgi:hypothetical protein
MMFTSPAVDRPTLPPGGQGLGLGLGLGFEVVGNCAPYILRSELPVSPSKTKITMPKLVKRKAAVVISGEQLSRLDRMDERQQRLNNRLSASMDGAQSHALQHSMTQAQKRVHDTVAKEKRKMSSMKRLQRSTSQQGGVERRAHEDSSGHRRRTTMSQVRKTQNSKSTLTPQEAMSNRSAREAAQKRVALQRKLQSQENNHNQSASTPKRVYQTLTSHTQVMSPPPRVPKQAHVQAAEDGMRAARRRVRDAAKAQAAVQRQAQEKQERKSKMTEAQSKELRRLAALRVKEHRDEQANLNKVKEQEQNKARRHREEMAAEAQQQAEKKRVLVYALNHVHQHFKQVQFEEYMKQLAAKREEDECFDSSSDSSSDDAAQPPPAIREEETKKKDEGEDVALAGGNPCSQDAPLPLAQPTTNVNVS